MITAIILPPTDASFCRVAGLPLIQRTILSAQRAGFAPVIVIGGAEETRLRELLAGDARTRPIAVVSDLMTARVDTSSVALIPSDCFVTPAALKRICEAGGDGKRLLFTPDDAGSDPYGIIRCSREELPELNDLLARGSLNTTPHATADPDTVPLNGEICLRITDANDARRAETRLIAQLRVETADTDGPIARFDRALSTRLSRLLVDTPLRPNHITTIGTVIGLIAGWCFARGTHAWGMLGALLFWCAIIIDGCDGEVARLKFQETKWGGLYDVVTDNVVHVAIFIGLGVGYFQAVAGDHAQWLVTALVCGFLCATTATYFCLIRHPPVQSLNPRSRQGKIRQRLLGGFEALMNRDFAYLLLPLALIGRLTWFIWGCVFGTYAYALGLAWIYRWGETE